VIEAGFGSVSPPVVVTETNVAGEAGYEGTPNPARGTAGTGGTGALAGDSDPGGTGMTITAVQGGTIGTFFNTTYGSLQLNADGSYVYYVGSAALSAPTGTPPVDTITYTVTDELGASSTATLKITDYRDPTAVAESATVNAGKSVIGTPGTTGTGALKGDTDPDGITPTISNYYDPTLINPPPAIGTAWAGKYGTVTIFANGTYSYTADSAATLAADFVAAGGQPLVDGFDYVVAGGDGTYTTSTLSITIPPPTPPDNYVANGKSALVLQNDAGPIVIESQSNLAVTGGGTISNPGPTWHVVSTADIDDNGSADLLLQNDNGTIVDYIMSGTSVAAGFNLTDPGSSWHVRGVGDFNGDGKGDIVLQNDNGTIVIDYTNGSAVIGGATIGNPGPGWTVEGVADFNGDGQSDLLLENTNGQIVDFLMNGATPVAGYLLTTLPAGWSVAGTGNYNGDNDADIVVHNDNGTDVVLNTNGQSIISSAAPIGDPGPTWTGVVAGMDLNGDGASDLVVENTSGSLVGFTLNTSDAVTQGASLGTPGVGWSVIGNTPMQFIDGTGPTLAPLTGTVGADEFNLTSLGVPGLHSINGFDPAMDLVALSAATFPTYAAVQAAEQPYQGGTFIALPNASGLLIQGTTPSQLSSSDFVLR
jgi:VCBS repeat-containing protein